MLVLRFAVFLVCVKLQIADEANQRDDTTSGGCIELGAYGEGFARIAGGAASENHGRPFQVALYTEADESGDGFCGGALVSADYVLTAAHCCHRGGALVRRVRAVLGAHSLYDRYENGRRLVNVDDIVVHPAWDADTYANDIALLKMATATQFTDTIEPVRLPYLDISSFSFAGSAATVSGWGIPAEGVAFISPTLREKVMTVMTNDLCSSFYFNTLPDNVICGFSPGAGTCKGDNGGPMTIFYSATNETILVGIATFVQQSGCNTALPSVFTRVQNYLDWISDVAGVPLD